LESGRPGWFHQCIKTLLLRGVNIHRPFGSQLARLGFRIGGSRDGNGDKVDAFSPSVHAQPSFTEGKSSEIEIEILSKPRRASENPH
jgi:hypothetical protein